MAPSPSVARSASLADRTLEELWSSAPPPRARFEPERTAALPEPARRYLAHAIAPGTPLPTAARLRMHGTMRLRDRWEPFEAVQVIRADRGFVWRARTTIRGIPVSGFDRLIDGEAALRWRLLGVVPVVTASGGEVARSAKGRFHAEAVWMPTLLAEPDVEWEPIDGSRARARMSRDEEPTSLELAVDPGGALRSLAMRRWGDLGTGRFRYEDFGGYVLEERRFGGITVPSTLRLGWYFGSERFEPEGEFFRVTVDELEHR